MSTFIKGFLAAVCGILLFLACLILWLELIGAGQGFFFRSNEEDEAVVAETSGTDDTSDNSDTSGTGTGDGTGADSNSAAGEISLEPMSTYNAWDDYEPAVEPTEEENAAAVSAAFDAFRARVETEQVKDKGKDNVTVTRQEHRIIINYWEDDLIDRLSAGQVDNTTMTLWNEMRTASKELCSAYYRQLGDEHLTNGHIIVNLLNERDLDEIILSYHDGRLVHNGLTQEHYESQQR